MDDRKKEIARSYLNRAKETTSQERKLLCLYDAFVSLYGPAEACIKASAFAKCSVSELKSCIAGCVEDSDVSSSPRPVIDASLLDALQFALERIL